MKNSVSRVLDTVRYYETLTAGRFYSDCQKENLFELASCANFLESKEKEDLFPIIFSPDLQFYQTKKDCENGLLLEMLSQNQIREAILESRLKALKTLSSPTEEKPWADKSAWLVYANSNMGGYKQSIEKAIFNFAVGKVEDATKQLEYHAKDCDLFSIKLIVAGYQKLGDKKSELYYLVLFSRIIKELHYEEVPPKAVARIEELLQEDLSDIENSAKSVPLRYFDERADGVARIGF